jgi:hypothetical protein
MLDEGLVTAGFGEAMDYHAGARVSRESAEGTTQRTGAPASLGGTPSPLVEPKG